MKTNKGKLTTLAMIVMALAIPATTYILKTENLDFRFSAADSEVPMNIMVTDTTDTSAAVSWQTERSVIGGIKIANGDGTLLLETEANNDHVLVIDNLDPSSSYNFSVLSDGTEYMNETSYYTFQTATKKVSDDTNELIYGQVFDLDGVTFQQGGLIYLELKKDDISSQKLVSKINEAGGYQLNLKGLRDTEHNKFEYWGMTDVSLTVQLIGQEPITRKYVVNLDYAHQLPNVYLGDVDIEFMPGIDGI